MRLFFLSPLKELRNCFLCIIRALRIYVSPHFVIIVYIRYQVLSDFVHSEEFLYKDSSCSHFILGDS